MIREDAIRRFLHTLYEVGPRQNQCITVTRRRCYRLLKAGAPLPEHSPKGSLLLSFKFEEFLEFDSLPNPWNSAHLGLLLPNGCNAAH
jgi:hypothetical protein